MLFLYINECKRSPYFFRFDFSLLDLLLDLERDLEEEDDDLFFAFSEDLEEELLLFLDLFLFKFYKTGHILKFFKLVFVWGSCLAGFGFVLFFFESLSCC